MHLLGSVSVAEEDSDAVIRPPRTGSLLSFFWPVLQAGFAGALAAAPVAGSAPTERPRHHAAPLQRLPLPVVLPAPPADATAPRLRIVSASSGSLRPDFDWAGVVAAAAGQVVHAELHRLVRAGQPAMALAMRPDAWARELRALGVSEPHVAAACARVEQALQRVAGSELAQRLLDPTHTESASELALTALAQGEVISLPHRSQLC